MEEYNAMTWTIEEADDVVRYVNDVWPGELSAAEVDIWCDALALYPVAVCKRSISSVRIHQEENYRPPPRTIADRCRELMPKPKPEPEPEVEKVSPERVQELLSGIRSGWAKRDAESDRHLEARQAVERAQEVAAEEHTRIVELVIVGRVIRNHLPDLTRLTFREDTARKLWFTRWPENDTAVVVKMLQECKPPLRCTVGRLEAGVVL